MDLTEQKLYMSLGIEEFKKPYLRIIEGIASLNAGEDAKVKIKKIRELNPVLEFESSKFPEFRRILKKFKGNVNSTLKNVGEVWLFVHEVSGYKDGYGSLVGEYVPATISPLPSDQFVYQSVFVNKKIASDLKDYCNYVELKSVRVKAYSPDEFLIYVDEIEKKDIFDVIKFYKNFGDDRSKDYKSIVMELSDDEKASCDLGASTLSSFNGLSYSIASKHKQSIEPNIRGTYEGLQMLLPPLFKREEFSLNFTPNSNVLPRNKKLKVVCKPIPVYDFDPDHLYLKSYNKTNPNQTWAASINTPSGSYSITEILNLFQTANYVTTVKEYPEPFDLSRLNANSAILDEEIWLWLVARRNFHVNLNKNSEAYFSRTFSGTISELFGEILPENCIKDAAAHSLVFEGFRRSFEDFCRFGTFENSGEDAKKFGNDYLKNIEGFIQSPEGRRFGLKELAAEQKKRIDKKSNLGKVGSNVVNSTIDMTSIAKEIPYGVLVSSISSGFEYDVKDVQKSVEWVIKEWGNNSRGWLKIKHKNNEKIVERVIPEIERITG